MAAGTGVGSCRPGGRDCQQPPEPEETRTLRVPEQAWPCHTRLQTHQQPRSQITFFHEPLTFKYKQTRSYGWHFRSLAGAVTLRAGGLSLLCWGHRHLRGNDHPGELAPGFRSFFFAGKRQCH